MCLNVRYAEKQRQGNESVCGGEERDRREREKEREKERERESEREWKRWRKSETEGLER